MTRYIGNHIRYAVVTDVNYDQGIMKTVWLDNNADDGQEIPIPHPAPGRGEGIYFGVRRGSVVALAISAYERYVPVAIMPTRGFYANVPDLPDSSFEDVGFPSISEGDVVLQGMTGGKAALYSEGEMLFENAFGEGMLIGGDPDRADRCAIIHAPPAEYRISQGGLRAAGIVRRDLRPDEDDLDVAAADPLHDLRFENVLEEVGRDPSKEISLSTRNSGSSGGDENADPADQFRNPPFIEKREILHEFGTEWFVGGQDFEEELLLGKRNQIPTRISEDRRERRTNVLSLSHAYPNELMETVEGTLVDLFGNLLDGNRHVLPRPPDKKEKEWLAAALENARHTIVFHREINSRKGWGYRNGGLEAFRHEPNSKVPADSSNNTRDRSRWFIDVDKEGLTKVNIPASSETGTVPVLARYENSSTVEVDDKGNALKKGRKDDDTLALFRPAPEKGKERRDIFLDQFGPGGIEVVSDDEKGGKGDPVPPNRLGGEKTSWIERGDKILQGTLPGTVQAGTAFHDITRTAGKLLSSSINRSSTDAVSASPPAAVPDDPAVHSKVNRTVPGKRTGSVALDAAGRPSGAPNAGGRSLHANLDGSLELSIGANTVDRVSWIMDTAGGLVARIGRDRLGRSAILHMDGTLAMEVGGFDFIGQSSGDKVDTRFVGGGKSRTQSLPKDQGVFKAGKVVIRVRRGTASGPDPAGADQLIIVDENGISLEATGRLNLTSSGDMTLKSKSRVIIDAPQIQLYEDLARFVIKNGNPVI